MDAYQVREGRWVVRDTHAAPARAVIVELQRNGESLFRATEFHVVPASGRQIGDFESVEAALAGVRVHVGEQSRKPRGDGDRE